MLENSIIKDNVNNAVKKAIIAYDNNMKKKIIQAYLQGKLSWIIRKEVFLWKYNLFLNSQK